MKTFSLRSILAVATVSVVLLAAPAAASAFAWSWQGWLPGDASQYPCIWHPGNETCSGWNYWDWSDAKIGPWAFVSDYIVGFENNNTIRGVHVYASQQKGTTPAGVSMGGYLKAQTLFSSGSSNNYVQACGSGGQYNPHCYF
jgi:hypothetical protein